MRREIEVRLSRTEIKAPVAGIVSRKTARIGATASSVGDPLFRIIKDGEIELEGEVPETQVTRLAQGRAGADRHRRQPDARRPGAPRLPRGRPGDAARQGAHRAAEESGLAHRRLRPRHGRGRSPHRASPCRCRRSSTTRKDRRCSPWSTTRSRPGGSAPGSRPKASSRSPKGSPPANSWSRAPAASSARATWFVRSSRTRPPRAGSALMRLNISAWAIRQPIPSIVLFIVLMLVGADQLPEPARHALPEHRHPDRLVTVTQAGAAPSELQNQVTKRVEDAVAGVNGVKHITVDDPGRHLDHDDRVPPGDQLRPRRQRRQGRGRQDPRRAAAHHRRADRAARRHRRPADRHLRRLRPGHDAGGAVLVGRRRRRPRAAERQGRRRRQPHRRRRPRDPGRARSRPPALARRHGGRREQAASPDQRRPRRRPRRGRRAGADDPHALGGAGPRHAGRDLHRAAGRPKGPPRRARDDRRRRPPSRAPSRASTASRSSPSPSRAPRAPATPRWPRPVATKVEELRGGEPERAPGADRLLRRVHGRQLRIGHAHPDRGRGARRARGADLPARLAGDADHGAGAAALGDPDLLGDER